MYFTIFKKKINLPPVFIWIFFNPESSGVCISTGTKCVGEIRYLITEYLKSLFSFFKSCRPVISADEITGMPSVTLDFIPERSEETLKEIFTYLNQSGVECYIAIDEFQQIMEYPEKGVEGLLRSYIQFTRMCILSFRAAKSI